MSLLLGLRNESKSIHERRVPVVPANISDLTSAGVKVRIQTAKQRAIPVAEYEAEGVEVNDDLSECDFIMGIKEVPKEELVANKTYCFFSHVIKGQEYNMTMLKKIMDLNCTLIDYEKMVNERGARVVAFGKQAGQAGTINAFHSLNHRLEALKKNNPFSICKQAKDYPSFAAAKKDLTTVGANIARDGLPDELTPFVVGITGAGNVGSGVFDILGALPNLVKWTPKEMLAAIADKSYDNKTIYQVVMDAGDLYEHAKNPDPETFTFQAFGAAPGDYTSAVPRFFQHFTLFINAVFWRPEWPKFITKDYLKGLWEADQKPRVLVISDVTCDIEGSVECTIKSTLPDEPSFIYHPIKMDAVDGFEGEGICIMAVDILPAEAPVESSTAFSNALKPYIVDMVKADYAKPLAEVKEQLHPYLHKAIIVHKGKLAPDYEYLTEPLAKHA